jgi:hypothetical protein
MLYSGGLIIRGLIISVYLLEQATKALLFRAMHFRVLPFRDLLLEVCF